mmetsp:Transcript_3041/g.10826  ORF Transcript_3041/g.10826 Transcript_3041/m.10826 type:complete len:316 (+) Transcript_3041:86-1033(+)
MAPSSGGSFTARGARRRVSEADGARRRRRLVARLGRGGPRGPALLVGGGLDGFAASGVVVRGGLAEFDERVELEQERLVEHLGQPFQADVDQRGDEERKRHGHGRERDDEDYRGGGELQERKLADGRKVEESEPVVRRLAQPLLRCHQAEALPELVAGQRAQGHEEEEAVEAGLWDEADDADQRLEADDAREQRLEEVRVALLVDFLDDVDHDSVALDLAEDAERLCVERRLRDEAVAGRDAKQPRGDDAPPQHEEVEVVGAALAQFKGLVLGHDGADVVVENKQHGYDGRRDERKQYRPGRAVAHRVDDPGAAM